MTEQRAEQLIVVSLFVFLASEIGGYLVTKQEKGKHLSKAQKKGIGRRIVGGFLTMFFASLFSVAAPEVGALLAISVASYAFFHDGLPAINRNYPKSKQTEYPEKRLPGSGLGPETQSESLPEEALKTSASPMVLTEILT